MKMKRVAIAVAAVASLASLGGLFPAKTPAVGQNTPAARRHSRPRLSTRTPSRQEIR